MRECELNPEERKPVMVSTQVDIMLEGKQEAVAGVVKAIGEILKDFTVHGGGVYVMDSKNPIILRG